MPYIGTSPSQGVRRVHTYTATASQTTFTGAGAEGATLSYKDSNFVDVYQNGVKLGDADYTATSGTSIVLGTGATVSDLIVIVAYDVFSVADTVSKADGGTFDGAVTFAGGITGPLAINDGDAGSVTANTVGDELVIESSGAGGLSILTPNASDAQVLLGGPDTNAGAILRWNDDANLISLGTNNTGGTLALKVGGFSDALTIDASANVTITGDIRKSTSGTSNFAAGVNAGNSIQSGGNYNTAVGDEAGTSISTGDSNVMVGYQAGALVDTGANIIAIGYQAGDAITSGENNIAIGKNALGAEDTHDFNIAIGSNALAVQNAGADAYNIAIGHNAGTTISTGLSNVIVGGLAGDALNTGGFNVAMGRSALTTDVKGSKSVAIGFGTLRAQTFASATDTLNTAVGFEAGNDITSGIQNTLIGGLAGDAISDSDGNTALGYGALGAEQQGNKSTAVGWQALLQANRGSSGDSFNTAVGYNAGSGINTGLKNTFIGGGSGSTVTSGDANTILGAYNGNNGGLDIRTASNNIVLSDGDGNPRIINDGTKTSIGEPTSSKTSTGTIEIKGTSANQSIITNSDNAVSYANNATLTFGSRSGIMIVNNHGTGSVELFAMGGGSVSRFAGSSTSSGAVTYSSPNYVWTNDEGATYTFTHTFIQTRNNV